MFAAAGLNAIQFVRILFASNVAYTSMHTWKEKKREKGTETKNIEINCIRIGAAAHLDSLKN